MVAMLGTLPFSPGRPTTMPTEPEPEPEPVTLSAIVHRAVAVVDPEGNAGLEDLLEPFEDDDEPLGSHGPEIAAQRIAEEALALDPDAGDHGVQLAAAVATYLAFHCDEVDEEPRALLTLAARAGFDGDPPPGVRALLAQRGVEL
jgi:hypothetical protein